MGALADFRRQYPQYDDMSDVELAEAIHRKYYSDLPKEQVFNRLGVKPTQAAQAAPPVGGVVAPAPAAAPQEDENFLVSALKRNVPLFKQNMATLVEDYPEIVGSIFATLSPTNPVAARVAKDLGKIAAKSETYKDISGETVRGLREEAAQRLAELGPGEYGSVFDEQGLGRKLGSLAETVTESALPVGAGIATGLVTRSPLAAGAVMGIGSAPMTYGGIRERQKAEGIDDVQRAVVGTAVSSALDILTGIGGKVLSGTAAVAAREILEAGLKQAAIRTVKSGGEEAVTEMLQNVVEQVAGGTNPATKKAMLETLESGLAGALGGTVFTGATEVVAAPFRPKAKAGVEGEVALPPVTDPAVRAEFQRVAAEEVAAAMAADPELDQRAAVDVVAQRAEELMSRAQANVAATQGGADGTSDIDTAVDVSGGSGAGVTPDLRPAPTEAGAPELGETVGGGLVEPVPSVPVPDVGTRAGELALTPPPAPEIATPTPLPEVAPAPAFDITPVMEAPTLKERTSAARQLISDVVQTAPELQALPKGKYTQAANQIAKSAARGEQFDPVEIIYKVAEVERPAPVAAPEVAAPEAPPAPPATRTINDMAGIGTVNPENTNEVLVEGGGVQLTPLSDNIIKVDSLRAVEKGGGRKALTELTKVADANGTELQLSPEPFKAPAGKEMTPTELSTWYTQFGFQEQPDGTMVRPAATPPSATITPAPQFTPQQIVEQIDQFARSEAEDRGFDPTMFQEGARDAARGVEPLPDDLILQGQGQEALDAYKSGMQFGLERVADMQAAPTPEAAPAVPAAPTPAPVEAAPAPVEATPAPEAGEPMVRLYRGEGPKEGKRSVGSDDNAGLWYHSVYDKAAKYAKRNNGEVYYVELPRSQAKALLQNSTTTMLPPELDAQRKVVSQPKTEANFNNWHGTPGVSTLPPAGGAVAMQTAPEAGGTAPINNTTVNAAVAPKLTKAQLRKLDEAAGIQRMKLSSMQKRIARSRSAEETMSLAGRLMLMVRKPGDNVNILTSLFNSTPPPVLQALLAPLETADVVRLSQRAGMENVTRIDDMMRNEYIPYVNRIMEKASKLSEKWSDFVSRSPEGAEAMGDVMYFSNMINADPSLAPNAAEYLKLDQDYQLLSAKLAAETDAKKKSTIKGQLTKRRGEIQRLYFGATDPDGAKIAGWNDVPAQGKQLFREARDYYRADFKEHYRLLIQRIDDAQFEEEDAARLKAAVDDMFKEADKRVIYFPMKRFGDYWVSVGKGSSGEFHMFESASAQDAFIARLRREGETREIDFSKGKDTLRLGLRNQTADASAALKGILDMIDGGGVSDVDLLKDHVFQMYLTALPEADMRRRFIHRQFKTGFSTDALRTFASTAIASANQLGRLAFNYKFKNLIDQSYAETAGNPSKRRLDTITREMEMRVQETMAPDSEGFWDQAANFGAKATFLFILSSPKSAVMNLTQLHIVGLPTLSAEFGEKDTYSMAARYTGQMLTGQRIANPFRDADGNIRLQLPEFTTEGSAYINGLRETDPDRYEAIQRAWEYAQEREVTESTFSSAANVYERSNEPSSEMSFTQAVRQGNAGLAVQRAAANAVNGMGALFHHTERMGREIMYMSAFELAYDRNLKQGMKPTAAADAAMVKATELTNKGMFDFSNWNKSRAAKHPVGKLALQMRSYSIAMTSLLFRSFSNMVALNRTKAERLAAARVFMGVGAMTTLYGGLRASQFYLLGMLGYGLYEFVKSGMGGDDEDKEIEQGYLDPETFERELLKYADDKGRELSKKDMDYFIRTVWIPENLGKGGTMQEALGLSDDTADKLATVADIGLPGVFGVDISNSVSLTSLWHPVDTKSDNPEAAFYEGLGRVILGPSGSMPAAVIKFNAEANAGNFDRAIEAITPAALRGYVKAERLKDEGLVIGKDRDITLKDPSFYDSYKVALQSLGFSDAETSRAMQLDIRAGEIEREIGAEKTALLDKRYQAIMGLGKGPTKEAERALAKVEREIEIYNLNYPSNAISSETKKRSIEQKQRDAGEKMYGLGMDSNIPIRQPLVEERAKRMMEEQ